MFKNIAVGISGGVDSAVAALLLKERGYNVVGVFMKNWDIINEQGFCTSSVDLEDAKYVCKKLKIPLREVNFVKQYWNYVFADFLLDYENGSTPNPDILCNKFIKFKCFTDYALDTLKCDAIATGHYARTSFGDYLERYKSEEKTRLLTSADSRKDQTYFLSQVSNKALQRTVFPLGSMVKSEVKKIAMTHGLDRIVSKKESTGICFVGTRKFQSFISEYVKPKKGNFIDIDTNKVVGFHDGIHMWTIGQRSKLSGLKGAYYVIKKVNNDIYVGMDHDHTALYSRQLTVSKLHWIYSEPDERIMKCFFRFQHGDELVPCQLIKISEGKLYIELEVALRALTSGQYGVFYKDNECLGSGRITLVGSDECAEYKLIDNIRTSHVS